MFTGDNGKIELSIKERNTVMKKIVIAFVSILTLASCSDADITLQQALPIALEAANCNDACDVIKQERRDDGFYFSVNKENEIIDVYLEEDGDLVSVEKKQAVTNELPVTNSNNNNGQGNTGNSTDTTCTTSVDELTQVVPQAILDDLGLSFTNICQLQVGQDEDDGKVYDVITFRSNQRHYTFELDNNTLHEYECYISNRNLDEGNLSNEDVLAIIYQLTGSDESNTKISEQEYDMYGHHYEFEGYFNGRYANIEVYDTGELKQLEWK